MCRMTKAVSWDSFQNLCLAIKTMFSKWQVVCVFFAVYKKYTCSLPNQQWYKLWLKIDVMCFSNIRFTCKIIFDISEQAKFVALQRQPGAVLAPVSHGSSRHRRQWKRLLLKVPIVCTDPMEGHGNISKGLLFLLNTIWEKLHRFLQRYTIETKEITTP